MDFDVEVKRFNRVELLSLNFGHGFQKDLAIANTLNGFNGTGITLDNFLNLKLVEKFHVRSFVFRVAFNHNEFWAIDQIDQTRGFDE